MAFTVSRLEYYLNLWTDIKYAVHISNSFSATSVLQERVGTKILETERLLAGTVIFAKGGATKF